ncbi:hypothetical protein Tco_0328779 [Tanacetum coccineum]
MGEGSANSTDPYHTPTIIQPSTSQPQKKQKTRIPKRKDTKIPQFSGPTDNVANEAINEEMDDCLERAATTATSLDVEQDKGCGPKRQETIGDTIAQTRSARMVSSDDASLGDQEDASKQGRKIDDIDKYAEITLIDETQGRYGDDLMFNIVVTTVSPTKTTTANDLTLAQTLIEIRSSKSKVKGVVIGEQSESTTRTRPQQLPSKDKGSETRAEGSSNRAIEELEQESSKKQKLEEDKESEELKKCLEIVPDDGDDVTIDATPLSTKSPTIVDYKIHKEGKKSFFQIIRADDNVWKNQQGLVKVLNWKLYDSCGVHCVTMQSMLFYLLVEKMYPLTKHTLHQMFNDVKLQVDYECEMAFELLRLVKKQLKEDNVWKNQQGLVKLRNLRSIQVGSTGLHTKEEMESPGFARSHAPEKRRFAVGRKIKAHISGGQFVARLAEHFGLLTAEIL